MRHESLSIEKRPLTSWQDDLYYTCIYLTWYNASIKWTVSYSVSAFVKAHGLAFDSEPNNTTIAATGSNQTFTWKLSLGEKDKSTQLQVQFGPWDRKYKIVKSFFMTVKQEPSGENETVARANQSTARRLHWNGDLSRDYYIAFELVNIQRKDAGDYGMRLRVDHFPPTILQNWFSLIVQVRRVFFSDRILRLLFCRISLLKLDIIY